MWFRIANIILRQRLFIISLLVVLTGLMTYMAISNLKVDTSFANILPEEDPERVKFEKFRKHFGVDGNIMVIGVEGSDMFDYKNFKAWKNLGNKIKKVHGVDSVFSIAELYNLRVNQAEDKFELTKFSFPANQKQLDVLKDSIYALPFYKDILYKDGIHLMMISMIPEIFDSENRKDMVVKIHSYAESYKKNFPQIRYSGLPYIRDVIGRKLVDEVGLFIGLAMGVTALILFLFFRSFRVVGVCMLVVAVGVTWSFGLMGIFNYKITIVMGLVPPLMIVIGIPNCIYLINKYHAEFATHQNKAKSLTRVIQKVGNATFLTNMTTALGFAAFIFTQSDKLQHFGTIASINIISLFFISLAIIPIYYSYSSTPKKKHTKHLDKNWVSSVVDGLVTVVSSYRIFVYLGSLLIIALSAYGITLMVTTGNVASDLPNGDPIKEDLHYFEETFGGVMPFEILLDTKKEKGGTDKRVLPRIEAAQKNLLDNITKGKTQILSRSLSITDALKFAHQALEEGDSSSYNLDISGRDKLKIKKYIGNATSDANVGNQFMDSTGRFVRISFQIADIGSNEMDGIKEKTELILDSTLNPGRDSLDYYISNYKSSASKEKALRTLLESEFLYDAYGDIKYELEEKLGEGKDSLFNAKFAEDLEHVYSFSGDPNLADLLVEIRNENNIESTVTGTSVVLAKGTSYMVKNLFTSLTLAIMVISIIMALLFSSIKMVLVSLLPNFIPLMVTAGIMGIFGIPIKPSTLLVFSIAFGISVDDTIHFLAKYRQELKQRNWNIAESVKASIQETGVSMIYTSIVLFFGFSMFTMSDFGGTVALGLLVSITLLIAMISNLVVLPSLLMSLDKIISNKTFKEPMLQMLDEEEDIDLKELEIENIEEE